MGGPYPLAPPLIILVPPFSINNNKIKRSQTNMYIILISVSQTYKHIDAQQCITVALDTLHNHTKFEL